MRKLLVFSALAVLAAPPALATDSGKCDAKPFTLKKPAAAEVAPKPDIAPPQPTKVAAPKPAPKPLKLVIGCKQPKG